MHEERVVGSVIGMDRHLGKGVETRSVPDRLTSGVSRSLLTPMFR